MAELDAAGSAPARTPSDRGIRPIVSGDWSGSMPDAARSPGSAADAAELHSRQLNSLTEIARLISTSCELNIVLNRVVSAVCQHTSWTSSGIMAVNHAQELSELVARYDTTLPPNVCPRTWSLPESATLRVVETGRPVIIADAQVCDEFPAYRRDAEIRGYRTVVVLPLDASDAEGREMTLAVHSREKVWVSEADLAFLYAISQLASIAVERAKRLLHEQAQAARLRQAIERSAALIGHALSDGSIERLVGLVETTLPNALLLYERATGKIVACRSPDPARLDAAEWQRLAEGPFRKPLLGLIAAPAGRPGSPRRLELALDDGPLVLHAVVSELAIEADAVGGLMIFTAGGPLDSFASLLAQEIKLSLTVALMRDHVRRKEQARSTDAFLEALVEGRWAGSAEIEARAAHLGIALEGPVRLVGVMRASAGQGQPPRPGPSPADIELETRTTQRALNGGAVVGRVDDRLIVLLPRHREDALPRGVCPLHRLHDALAARLGEPVVVADGGVCATGADYRDAYAQVRQVGALAQVFGRSGVLSQADFGYVGMLLSSAEQGVLARFVSTTLGRIEDYDRRHATDLVATLKAFIDLGCRYQHCADSLGIHVSTLRYRLRKIREDLQVDIDDPDARLGLALAIRLKELSLRG